MKKLLSYFTHLLDRRENNAEVLSLDPIISTQDTTHNENQGVDEEYISHNENRSVNGNCMTNNDIGSANEECITPNEIIEECIINKENGSVNEECIINNDECITNHECITNEESITNDENESVNEEYTTHNKTIGQPTKKKAHPHHLTSCYVNLTRLQENTTTSTRISSLPPLQYPQPLIVCKGICTRSQSMSIRRQATKKKLQPHHLKSCYINLTRLPENISTGTRISSSPPLQHPQPCIVRKTQPTRSHASSNLRRKRHIMAIRNCNASPSNAYEPVICSNLIQAENSQLINIDHVITNQDPNAFLVCPLETNSLSYNSHPISPIPPTAIVNDSLVAVPPATGPLESVALNNTLRSFAAHNLPLTNQIHHPVSSYVYYRQRLVLSTNIQPINLGPLSFPCVFCAALHFRDEVEYHKCCSKNKVNLPLPIVPPLFISLLENPEYFSRIREYNSLMAFASICSTIIPTNGAPSFLKIQGQVYHRLSVDNPCPNGNSFAQLYMLDSSIANNQRLSNAMSSNISMQILDEIDSYLRVNNPFAREFRRIGLSSEGSTSNLNLAFLQTTARTYEAPTTNEIAAFYTDHDGDGAPPANVDLSVYNVRAGRYNRLSYYDANAMALCLPLLLPHGELMWDLNHFSTRRPELLRRRISSLQFYNFYLYERAGYFSLMLNSGKLSQQLMIEIYLKSETARLNYVRTHQASFRVDMYRGLLEHVSTDDPDNLNRRGRACILPSSFHGDPRHREKLYQDDITYNIRFGCPSFFITFTCNPNWTEITANLKSNQTYIDRPDLVSRVFHLKWQRITHMLLKEHLLGKIRAYVWVVEFQKRGLPHTHSLFWLEPRHAIDTPEKVDMFVSAEIPDPLSDPTLHSLVTTHMLHKCSPNCLDQNRVCSKSFPKAFLPNTILNDAHVDYRRRVTGITHTLNNRIYDNRHVVSYNSTLLKAAASHINFVLVFSPTVLRYLFKYFHKGDDRASVELTGPDEVTNFVTGRYISSIEASYNNHSFPKHGSSHHIEMLPIHLPGEQLIRYTEGAERDAIAAANLNPTRLISFFPLCQNDPQARELLYIDLPIFYRWLNYIWTRRKRSKVLARLVIVSPRDTERFALRQLLLNVPGPLSWEYLRTVNGIVCETFHEAAIMLNILVNDHEWDICLTEVSDRCNASSLRTFFSQLLVNADTMDCLSVWNKFKGNMIADYIRHGRPLNVAYDMALSFIQRILLSNNKSPTNYNLPFPEINVNGLPEIIPQSFISNEDCIKYRDSLNHEQSNIYYTVYNAVRNRNDSTIDKYFFLNGPGGTGKTYLLNVIIKCFRFDGYEVAPVASTGIASTLLETGYTAHSFFQIPINCDSTSTCNLTLEDIRSVSIKKLNLIIWDEVTMSSINHIRAVNRYLQDLFNNNFFFGGVPVLFCGDYRQILPVVKGNRGSIVSHALRLSVYWQNLIILNLTMNMRTSPDDLTFSNWLLDLGVGRLGEVDTDGVSYVPLADDTIIVGDILDSIRLHLNNLNFFAVLCTTNDEVYRLNHAILGLLPGITTTFFSVDTPISDDSQTSIDYPPEYLNILNPSNMPYHVLKLKIGCIVMLIRNIDVRSGLSNGVRMTVNEIGRHFLNLTIIQGPFAGKEVFLSRLDFTHSDHSMTIPFKRRQFPIKLAHAITINKSQGQTFDNLVLSLEKPVFTHGQCYVAFSRVRNLASVKVKLASNTQGVKNVVWEEILLPS